MSGTVVGAVFGCGVFCVWWSCWPRPARPVRERRHRVADLLRHAGFPAVPPVVLPLASVLLALLAFVATAAVSGVVVLGLCAAVAAAWAPAALLRRRAAVRTSARSAQWPDVVDQLASSVRAGMSLPDGVCALAQRGPELLRPEFAVFAAGYRASGNFEGELRALAGRLADPVFDRLAAALRMTRQVGGSDLGRTLRTLSGYLREDARTRGELLARQSWTVSAARLAVAAPWIVLALLASRPGALDAYSTATGAFVLLGGGAASALAYRLMLHWARLPQPRRVFA
ncbi:type II secretion system F family protein [Kineococcus rubinsiae]|uniref:type II secretion system F family protein n=1 Tax=Kineococcus rubinsiae TaxID=2609562 RepID=UPI00142F5EE5|nr:type II secretion system F family protein [Kineococcus rubinsiae]NIZ90808.1 type II secretion system protein F [Kineococcus rubinsiae]